MSNRDKVIEGKFNYFLDGSQYTQEEFRVFKDANAKANLNFEAEVTSRVKTGEFLKVACQYRFTSKFVPIKCSITRSMGENTSEEIFLFDDKTKNVSYEFNANGKTKRHEKVITSKPHVAAPCFSLSMLMVNAKKIDPVQRTPYTLLSTQNIWDYHGPFVEQEIYLELQELEPIKINIDGKQLKATHCKILQVNDKGTIIDGGDDVYLSKHYYIPYYGKFKNDLTIKIETLKHYEDKVRM